MISAYAAAAKDADASTCRIFVQQRQARDDSALAFAVAMLFMLDAFLGHACPRRSITTPTTSIVDLAAPFARSWCTTFSVLRSESLATHSDFPELKMAYRLASHKPLASSLSGLPSALLPNHGRCRLRHAPDIRLGHSCSPSSLIASQ